MESNQTEQTQTEQKKPNNALGCLLAIILIVGVVQGCSWIANSSSSSKKSCAWDTNCDGFMSGNESERQIRDAAKRLNR